MNRVKELISIVITTHARGNRLEYAVKSAVNQTYKNIEVIVVDDNSDCLKERRKTEQIAKKYPNVKLVENAKNLGGAMSRNAGIMAAKGNLISFLDDDDQYLPNRIEKLYKLFEEHKKDNIGLAYCSCDAIDENGNVINEYVNVANGRPFYQHMLGCIAGTSMWLASKDVLNSVGNFDDVPSKQDSTLILKMIDAGYSVYGTPEKLVLYLEHSGERISGAKPSNIEGIKIYREKCRKQYYRLKKKESAKIECNFSNQLISIYLVNNNVLNAKEEFRNIRRNNLVSKVCFRNLLKIMFYKKYNARIKRSKDERR